METIAVAIVAGVLGPLVLAYMTGRQRSRDKKEDWARQDQVAERAREAAELLLEAQRKTTAKADEVARKAEEVASRVELASAAADAHAAATDEQLVQIHTLVNSDMTAARQSELHQTRITLATMKKVIELDSTAGRKPTADDIAAVEMTESRIIELETIVDDRLAQQKAIEEQQAQKHQVAAK